MLRRSHDLGAKGAILSGSIRGGEGAILMEEKGAERKRKANKDWKDLNTI